MLGIKFAVHSSVFLLYVSVYQFVSFCQIDFPGQFTCLIRKKAILVMFKSGWFSMC